MTAQEYIKILNLEKHVEGGYFRQVYISEVDNEQKQAISSIYFLIEKDQYSAFHQLSSDEIWYFHDGDPLVIYAYDQNLKLHEYKLGKDISKGYRFQVTIPKGYIFASKTQARYSLVSCAVAPAFTYEDFKLYDRDMLLELGLADTDLIRELAYQKK